MTPPATGPMNLNGSSGWTPPDSSHLRLQLDNLLRRELKVGDPSDAQQVAQALLNRYQGTSRARAIEQEAKGLPYLPVPALLPQMGVPQGSSTAELQQAMDDVERDLRELTTNTLLKDVTPELEGWAQSVRAAVREGTNAARFGLDPRQRDKAMAVRRQLGDYARIARLVGALTPSMNLTYRKFAQSLDEVASVILVGLGESLANLGFSGGQYLLQVPYTELQVRRDAAIYALRNLTGATQASYGQSEWPRGLDAYRRLFERLEQQGQGELRSLLVEGELARIMDTLIQRAAHGNPEGLRALGATAELDLDCFRRLVLIGSEIAIPESPPLASFLQTLQLFADAFARGGGFRLLRIARPPILSYGLYGMAGLSPAEHRLLDLIIQRNRLADLLDCYLECGCSAPRVACQVQLDKILYDIDRAIDLYAFGLDDFGEPEQRASGYGLLIDTFLQLDATRNPRCLAAGEATNVVDALERVRDGLTPALLAEDPQTLADTEVGHLANILLVFAGEVLAALGLAGLCPGGPGDPCASINAAVLAIQAGQIANQIGIDDLAALLTATLDGRVELIENDFAAPDVPPEVEPVFRLAVQELCLQRDGERRWRRLVESLAPSCLRQRNVLQGPETLIARTIDRVAGSCRRTPLRIPPDAETSLDGLVNGVSIVGAGR
jgi:hypothetical protein